MAVKNWVYGAKTPDIEQAVNDAIFAAHRYRNRLCELELEKRKRHYDLLRRFAPEFVLAEAAIAECESELAGVRAAIQAERVKQRTKKPSGVAHLVLRAQGCKELLKEHRARCKASKKDAYERPEVIDAMQRNAAQHKAERAEAYADSGLYWGTEAVVSQSCRSFAAGAPPKFKRYEGEGQLAVQIQGGLDCADAVRSNTLCYLGEAIDRRKRWCFIRIGSDGGKAIFARVPVVFHRNLPAGRIKWVYLERRKIATHVRWSIRLTIDCGQEPDRCRDGEVAVHTGWRMEPSGLRVCTWLGSDGKRGSLILPNQHCGDYAKLDSTRSARDVAFNEMIVGIREWAQDRDVPSCVAEVRAHLHLWKSPARLAKLYWKWIECRVSGDEEIVSRLNRWRKSDKQQWQHERRLAVRITRRRKDAFRKLAKQLADEYGVAIVSPIDAKALTANTQPEELERDNTQAHRHAKWAAVSELTQCVREKFPLHCVDVSPVNITRQCCNCGDLSDSNKRKVQCLGCGHTHDIDENAVANTLARGEAAIKSGALLDLVAVQEDKAAAQAAKLVKMQEARRAARRSKQISNELQV